MVYISEVKPFKQFQVLEVSNFRRGAKSQISPTAEQAEITKRNNLRTPALPYPKNHPENADYTNHQGAQKQIFKDVPLTQIKTQLRGPMDREVLSIKRVFIF